MCVYDVHMRTQPHDGCGDGCALMLSTSTCLQTFISHECELTAPVAIHYIGIGERSKERKSIQSCLSHFSFFKVVNLFAVDVDTCDISNARRKLISHQLITFQSCAALLFSQLTLSTIYSTWSLCRTNTFRKETNTMRTRAHIHDSNHTAQNEAIDCNAKINRLIEKLIIYKPSWNRFQLFIGRISIACSTFYWFSWFTIGCSWKWWWRGRCVNAMGSCPTIDRNKLNE